MVVEPGVDDGWRNPYPRESLHWPTWCRQQGVPTPAPGWKTPPGTLLSPAGLRARQGTAGGCGCPPRPRAGVTLRGGHTRHCHSTRSPRTPPAPGSGAGNRAGRGTATAPLRAPGKGHGAPTATPRQAEGGRRRQPAAFSRGRGFLHRTEVLLMPYDHLISFGTGLGLGMSPSPAPSNHGSSFTGITHRITLLIRSAMR